MSFEDGLEFLADETGELLEDLPPIASEICKLVNNHKVASHGNSTHQYLEISDSD